MRVLTTSLVPPGLREIPGIRWDNPFLELYPQSRLDSALGRRLPRNLPIYAHLLASYLEETAPAAALYITPTDPREFLALYEAHAVRTDGQFRPLVCTVHPSVDRQERERQLQLAYQLLGGEWTNVPRGMDWRRARRLERQWMLDRSVGSLEAFQHSLALLPARDDNCFGEGLELVRPTLPETQSIKRAVRASEDCPRLALFGDWPLMGGIFEEVDRLGGRIVWAQGLYDQLQWGQDTDIEWMDHFAFRSTEEKRAAYAMEFGRRGVRGAIGLYAPFSHGRLTCDHPLQELGIPLLWLESMLPGALTAQEKLRLESFFRLLG